MIRLTLLWLFVIFLSAYAFKDWFKSLCGLILLMAVVEHPDFPKSVMDIQGLNAWNVLLACVVLGWASARGREGLVWDMPRSVATLLVVYFLLILISFIRFVSDLDSFTAYRAAVSLEPATFAGLFSEKIINCLKWVVPGLLLYDGCRSEERFRLAVYCIVGIYVLLAIQVIRWMPIASLTSGEELSERSIKILLNEVGYHRVNMSMLLAGGSWAVFCARTLSDSKIVHIVGVLFFAMVFFGLALTGGRMGYVTWAAIGLIFGLTKWRRVIVLGPIALLILISLVPAVRERFEQGFSAETIDTNASIEQHFYGGDDAAALYTVTSGRTFAWPFVLREIGDSPLVGYGQEAMITTGVALMLYTNYGESFPHPHNAYLQWIFDNGIIGLIPVFIFYWLIFRIAIGLFRDTDRRCTIIGGVLLALLSALLIASFGSQSFYPREGAVGMWCAIGLALRVREMRRKQLQQSARSTGSVTAENQGFWSAGQAQRKIERRYYAV